MNQYDDPEFFNEYAKMSRSRFGLEGAGEWHQLEPLFPELCNKLVLDLGCGYGWHCKYAAEQGADAVFGIDKSARMIEEAKRRNSDDTIEYRVCGIKVELIEDPLMQNIRYLDKLVDELAKGKAMDKILRK